MHASEVSRAPKKHGPLFWILIGVGSFLLVLLIAGGSLAYFGFRALEQRTGMDSAAMKEHPVRVYVLANPDNELLSEDSNTGEIRYRSKKTKEEFISSMDPNTQRFVTIRVTSAPETK